MGQRTLKRVPLDFDWPMNEVWSGYLGPESRPCPADCRTGATIEGQWVSSIVHLLLMLGERPRDGRMHPWLASLPLNPGRLPTERMGELTGGLAGRSPRGWGHDAIDNWHAVYAIYEAAGLPKDWGTCPTCQGHGIHPDDIEASDAWVETEPPVGEGWQLWETTSEGSPVSPVFATAEELADWCAPNASLFAGERAPRDYWLRSFVSDDVDLASTMVLVVPKQ